MSQYDILIAILEKCQCRWKIDRKCNFCSFCRDVSLYPGLHRLKEEGLVEGFNIADASLTMKALEYIKVMKKLNPPSYSDYEIISMMANGGISKEQCSTLLSF